MLVAVAAACIPDCNRGNVVATALDCLVVTKPALHSARKVITGLFSCSPKPKDFRPAPSTVGPIKLRSCARMTYTRMCPCRQSL